MVCVGKAVKSQYFVVALLIVENGPRPAQKHHEAGSLLKPIAVLFPSLKIGAEAGVMVEEALLVCEAVFETDELVDEPVVEPVVVASLEDQVM